MPLSTQALYFHLSMRADDDGFINSPRKIQRVVGASDDDLKLLIAKNFIIPFESGVVVIKHWRIHNYIQKDRYTETVYQEEKQLLSMKENKAYTINENSVDTKCIQNVSNLDAQVSIGKVSKGKDNNIKAPAEPSVASVIAESDLTEEVKAALREFSKMRTATKNKLTPRAMEIIISKLKGLSEDPATQETIVNQSIERGWQSVYPLKEDKKSQEAPKKPAGKFYDFEEHPHTPESDVDFEAQILRKQREERERKRLQDANQQ